MRVVQAGTGRARKRRRVVVESSSSDSDSSDGESGGGVLGGGLSGMAVVLVAGRLVAGAESGRECGVGSGGGAERHQAGAAEARGALGGGGKRGWVE